MGYLGKMGEKIQEKWKIMKEIQMKTHSCTFLHRLQKKMYRYVIHTYNNRKALDIKIKTVPK